MSDYRAQIDRDILTFAIFAVAGGLLWQSESMVLALLCLAIAFIFATSSPTGAFWACCLAVPIWQHPVSIGSLQFSLLELGIVVSFAGLVSNLALSSIHNHRIQRALRIPWMVLLLGICLLVAGILSLLYMPSRDHVDEAERLFRWVIIEPLLALVLAVFAIRKRGRRPVALVLVGTGVLTTMAAGIELAVGKDAFRADNVTRATGPYLHPNNLALYLDRMVFLSAGPALILAGAKKRPWLVATAVLFAGILLTFSRGSLLALLAGWFVLALLTRNRTVFRLGLLGMALAILAFVLVASDRLFGSSSSGIGTTRLGLWRSSERMIRDFPVSGLGLDQFLYWHPVRYIEPANWSERYVSHPHNLLLDSWISLGVGGLIVLVLAATLLSRQIWQIAQTDPVNPYGAGALAALCGGLVHGMVDNGYFLPDIAFLTWVSVALVVTCKDEVTSVLLPTDSVTGHLESEDLDH